MLVRSRIVCVVALLACIGPVRLAYAAKAETSIAESLTGPARKAYRLGVVLFDDGDWVGALNQFETAHQLSGDARLLWNMAVCEKNRRRYTRALTLVEQYLAARAPRSSPRDLRDAMAFRDTVQKLTRLVKIEVDQAGASVSLDGEAIGSTPLPGEVRIDSGDHDLLIQKKGFIDEQLKLTANTELPKLITMRPDEGRLVIRAMPPAAAISIDGRAAGRGSFDGMHPSGPAFVKITADGMQGFQDEILIGRGETRALDVTLEPVSSRKTWAWVAAGAVVLGAAAVSAYFIANPTIERPPIQDGSWATVHLGR